MANNPQFSDAWVVGALSGASPQLNSGFLVVYTGTQPADGNQALTGTLLVTLPLSATAFQTPVASGATGSRTAVITANNIGTANAVATGTAGYWALLKSDGITVVTMGSVGTSGADANFNSLSISSGSPVSCSSLTITLPEN